MRKSLLIALFIALSTNFTFATDDIETEQQEVIESPISPTINRIGNSDLDVTLPNYVFTNTNTKIQLQFKDAKNIKLTENNYSLRFIVNGEDIAVKFDEKGTGIINYTFVSNSGLSIYFEDFKYESTLNVISIWYVIIPIALLGFLLGFKLMKRKRSNSIENIENISTTTKNDFVEETKKRNAVKEELEEEILS